MSCKNMHSIEELNSILLLTTRKLQSEKQLHTKNREYLSKIMIKRLIE